MDDFKENSNICAYLAQFPTPQMGRQFRVTCCVSGNNILQRMAKFTKQCSLFVGLAYQGKDIMFPFIIEYSSLRDFGP